MTIDDRRLCDICQNPAHGPKLFSAWNGVGFPDAGDIRTQSLDLCAVCQFDDEIRLTSQNLTATL